MLIYETLIQSWNSSLQLKFIKFSIKKGSNIKTHTCNSFLKQNETIEKNERNTLSIDTKLRRYLWMNKSNSSILLTMMVKLQCITLLYEKIFISYNFYWKTVQIYSLKTQKIVDLITVQRSHQKFNCCWVELNKNTLI